MPKFPKSRLVKINAARKAAGKVGKVGGVKKVVGCVKSGVKAEPVEIRVNGYTIYHFPNLGIFAKVKHETWLTAKGYQPSHESLRKVSPEFVANVITAKIEGRLQ